ncbi:MAG: thiamine-phosphate kinase [Candidatus Latescibacteria bacterium]|jgi:thiamine-monophosphate kinase|nr:thiamine-phosphate kinase [Candidatus Latescibacterota bacterium]
MTTHKKTLAEVGELEFIRHIRCLIPGDGGIFLRSVGDDCLVAESFAQDHILATTDTFVDGVHFTLDYFNFEQAGGRCMAAAVSDIAAMSGIPEYSLVSLAMPKNTLFNDAVSLFTGLQKKAEQYGCPVAGGETTSTPGPVTVTVTVIGRVEPGRAVTRSGTRLDDGIFITGTIGDAMAGLMAFERNEKEFQVLKSKFVTPEALVTLSRSLTTAYSITSMIDVSDGLAADLRHICEESGCGAEIDASLLPLSNEYKKFSEKYSLDTVDFALSSGEEFELLFTSDDGSIPEQFTLEDRAITRIGTVIETSGGLKLYRGSSYTEPLIQKGYEHFK